MLRRTLNLGILAHVDAGKTTLTERLLYAAGVIDAMGSVDAGSTQTDSLALERRRGITIKSAVASFAIGDVGVNLLDTLGHPDFIAEVERALGVLDGAVLVVSAVEGVQPQTRVLFRALERLRVPTLVFVNKIDRRGADPAAAFGAIASRLTGAAVALGAPSDAGTHRAAFRSFSGRDASFLDRLSSSLAEHDERLLAELVDDPASVSYARLRRVLADQVRRALVRPVLFGSAITGAGVAALMQAAAELLPAASGSADGAPCGRVFKVERTATGERVAYLRMFSGALRVRDRVRCGGEAARPVTAIAVFQTGAPRPHPQLRAGEVGLVHGLRDARVGDVLGALPGGSPHRFGRPTLEAVVVPRRRDDRRALHAALVQLAEQDPLIGLRLGGDGELRLSLYGAVQQTVIQATLAEDFGLDVAFRDATTICVERPIATGEAREVLGAPGNPHLATIGLRVEPGEPGSGTELLLDVRLESVPVYVYRSVEEVRAALEQTVRAALRHGVHGWEVVDARITLTDCGYSAPGTSARDFRLLGPDVLRRALEAAGTVVCEPIHRFHLEVPAAALSAALATLARLRALPEAPRLGGPSCVIEGDIPAACIQELRRRLPGLSGGEGLLESTLSRYDPAPQAPRARRRYMSKAPKSRIA